MVLMIRDNTGRFLKGPILRKTNSIGNASKSFRLCYKTAWRSDLSRTDDDLHVLIEEHADSLDSFADLSDYGDDVEGVTAFFPDRRPEVFISEKLSNDPRRKNRFRTTLAHEFGHGLFPSPPVGRKIFGRSAL